MQKLSASPRLDIPFLSAYALATAIPTSLIPHRRDYSGIKILLEKQDGKSQLRENVFVFQKLLAYQSETERG